MPCDTCPTCGQPWPVAHRVERELVKLREWIEREHVHPIAGRISERDAARYLGRAPRTLRGWRDGERPLPFLMLGGRPYYAPEDVAVLMVDSQQW